MQLWDEWDKPVAILKGFGIGGNIYISLYRNEQAMDIGSFEMAPRERRSGLYYDT